MEKVLSAIDEEIARLTQARILLAGDIPQRAKPGPKPGPKPGKLRIISAEGRARIAAAQKARWAKKK